MSQDHCIHELYNCGCQKASQDQANQPFSMAEEGTNKLPQTAEELLTTDCH